MIADRLIAFLTELGLEVEQAERQRA